MLPQLLRTQLTQVLTTWVERLLQLPADTHLVMDPSGTPFTFVGGVPVGRMNVAETSQDYANLQAVGETFYDFRTKLIWAWNGPYFDSRPYTGDLPVWRPQSLCYAPNQNALYYLDSNFQSFRVNLSTQLPPP